MGENKDLGRTNDRIKLSKIHYLLITIFILNLIFREDKFIKVTNIFKLKYYAKLLLKIPIFKGKCIAVRESEGVDHPMSEGDIPLARYVHSSCFMGTA